MKVPVSIPYTDEDDVKLVADAVRSGEISGNFGKYIDEFEKGFAAYCGCEYGVTVSNGTTALHLAVATLGIGPGDEVLVSASTNMASFFSVIYTGARPIPVDVLPDTYNLDPKLLEAKITSKTKAIMVVHLFGHPVDMDPVLQIAKKHKLFVIEDAAEAHGAEYNGKRVGSLGDIGVFSFYANKIITTGEGGMLTMNSKELADRARDLKSLTYGKVSRFMHTDIGFNYRMTNIQAALGVSQLKKIEKFIEKKRAIADFYNAHLKNVPGLQLPVEKSYAKNVYWMYYMVLTGKLEGKRGEVMKALKEGGVDTREGFVPYNMQEIFMKRGWTRREECPVANRVGENGFYIPSSFTIMDEEMKYVADSLKEILKGI